MIPPRVVVALAAAYGPHGGYHACLTLLGIGTILVCRARAGLPVFADPPRP